LAENGAKFSGVMIMRKALGTLAQNAYKPLADFLRPEQKQTPWMRIPQRLDGFGPIGHLLSAAPRC
jgi:hypothetical protein